MRLRYLLALVSSLLWILTLAMAANNGVDFLVLKLDPSRGKWREMRYEARDQDYFRELNTPAPSLPELEALFVNSRTHGERASLVLFQQVEDKYPVFAMRFRGVAPGRWSRSSPFFWPVLCCAVVSVLAFGSLWILQWRRGYAGGR